MLRQAQAQLALAFGSSDSALSLAAGTDCLREQAQLARSPTAELTWLAFLQRLQDAMSPEAHATAWQQAWGSGTSELMRLAQGLRADGGGAIQA